MDLPVVFNKLSMVSNSILETFGEATYEVRPPAIIEINNCSFVTKGFNFLNKSSAWYGFTAIKIISATGTQSAKFLYASKFDIWSTSSSFSSEVSRTIMFSFFKSLDFDIPFA